MTYTPRPDAVGVAWLKINFDRMKWLATAIRETNTRFASSRYRQHSPAEGAAKNDDELPPRLVPVHVMKMSRAACESVDAVRLGNYPKQTVKDE
jgi:hypothetical protein